MKQFKRSLLSVALASALQAVAANAYAQPVDDVAAAQTADATAQGEQAAKNDEGEAVRVEVTGIRAGIEKSIDTKRESTEIVESISAEDIGKLPDVSIAESIARLPGLTAQRVAGRASTIQIRGLADDFGATTLNGREQVSVGNNRGVEFDQYPSELLSAVKVYKTPNASLVGQGLSGTVDLQTVRPLSYTERVMAASVRLEENSKGELNPGYDDRGHRLSFSYIDQFANNTVGVAIGVARLDSPGQAERWEAWGYPTTTVNGEQAYLLGGSKSQASSSDNVRDGVMAVIEFKPNDAYTSVLDLYYSKFETTETLRFMETGLGWSGATLSNAVVENGRVISGTFTGVRPVLRNDLNTWDDKIYSVGWNNEFQFNDDWKGAADLSFSKAERDTSLIETYAGLGASSNPAAGDTVNFVIGNAGLPQFTYNRDYTDPQQIVLTDPGGWGQEGFEKYPHVEDDLKALRLSAERTFAEGMFKSLEMGVNFSDREKSRASGYEGFLCLTGGATGCVRNGDEVAIPAGALNSAADLSFTGIPGSISYDVGSVLGLYDHVQLRHQDVNNKNWTVTEEITTAYVQLNLDSDLGSMPVRGNVGVQVVHTDQSSTGQIVPFGDADAPVAISGGATYDDVLPSLNLGLTVADDQVVRIGLGKQLARARLDDMRANQNVSIRVDRDPNGEWTGSGGNPELKPWEAYAADLSYELYFGDTGYVSFGAFYKDLRTYIYSQTVAYDFSGYDPRAFTPDSPIGEFTTPANGKGGSLEGWEVAASVPFNLMADVLDGFGIQASYSDTSSSIEPNGPDGVKEPIPGLSEEISNITLYYEMSGFQARVSQRSRSDFLGEVQGFGGDRSKRYIKGEDIVDIQFGYSFTEGSSFEGLSVLLQVNNLTDEPYQEYFADTNLPRMYNEYGRTVLAGVNYKF